VRQSRRLHYRHPIQSLVYVTLDNGNGGIVRNLSQDGAAIQAVGALNPNQTLRVRFDLLSYEFAEDQRFGKVFRADHDAVGVRRRA